MLKLFSRKSGSKNQDISKKKYKIIDMHCVSCCFTIDEKVESVVGVKSSQTSYHQGLTEVEVISETIKDQDILQAIEKAGYTAIPLDT